jgi:hypothetical protein
MFNTQQIVSYHSALAPYIISDYQVRTLIKVKSKKSTIKQIIYLKPYVI